MFTCSPLLLNSAPTALLRRLAALLLTLTCTIGWAAELEIPISRFHHTEWTEKDGAPIDVWAIAQTKDGWLWFGGTSGLFRFDGVQFERVPTSAPDSQESVAVSALFALESGELAIGYQQSGVSILKDGRFTHYRGEQDFRRGSIFAFARDLDAVLWAASPTELRRFDGQHWQSIGKDWNFPEGGAGVVFADQAGVVWVTCREGVLRLARGSRKFERLGMRVGTVGDFVQSTDGRAWLSEQSGVTILPGQDAMSAPSPLTNGRESHNSLVDQQGNFWSLYPADIHRLPNPFQSSVTGLDQKLGLKTIMEDDEGNVWISAVASIHRYQRQDVNRVAFPENTGQLRAFGLAVANDGTAWMSVRSSRMAAFPIDGIWKLDESRPAIQQPQIEPVSAMHRDIDGSVWVAGSKAILRYERGGFRKAIDLPADAANGLARGIEVDSGGVVWISMWSLGLFCGTGGTWVRNCGLTDLPPGEPLAMSRDAQGGVWLGYGDGTVRVVAGGRARLLDHGSGLQLGAISAIAAGSHVLVAGERGLAVLQDKRFLTLEPGTTGAFAGIRSALELASGDVWLNGEKGAVRIGAAALRAALAQNAPKATVIVEVFGNEEGYPGAGASGSGILRAMSATPDGRRMWVGGNDGVGWIDPSQIRTRTAPTRALIRSLTANGGQFDPVRGLQLAKGTRGLQIDYTALSYAHPERVRFRYRLGGVDDAWVEAAARRQAFYSNLGPGSYTFVVSATNTGSSDASTATVAFVIPPTFVQSTGFIALCVLIVVAASILAYQLRIRQITARVRGRLEERLAERERIARELHDTLLQGTEGLMLTVHAAAKRIPPEDPTRQMLDLALERASGVMTEGRDRILDLRSAADSHGQLAASFAVFGEELARGRDTEFRVVSVGPIRELPQGFDDEVILIGREALSNAFRHAGAQSIELQILYGESELRVRIRDNGRGMDETSLETEAKPGHWGLQGMQERAQKLGAQLKVLSRPGAGTEIELVVPAPPSPSKAAKQEWRSFGFLRGWLR